MSKKSYLKEKSHKKLIREYWGVRGLVIVMVLILIYDAFIHDTPLYYIGFYYAGLVIGRGFWFTQKVEHDLETDQFNLVSTRWHIVLLLVLLSVRFVVGKIVLEQFHVVWATDALYLLFVGIYRSRYKGLVKQVDELIYGRF